MGDINAGSRWADFDPETTADALEMLADLAGWTLAPARWDEVDRILARIDRVLVAGDAQSLRDALIDLELAGPVKATRIGAEDLRPASDETLYRRTQLIYALGAPAGPDPQPRYVHGGGRAEPGGGRRVSD